MTSDDEFTALCLVGQGLIPGAPWAPKIATRVLELYRVARLRCPTLSIQPWLKTLSDVHSVAFKPYMAQLFSNCFVVYLDILKTVDEHVDKVLGRDAADWRLKNCCLACTYKLEGKAKLMFDMLSAMDGNNSLKCVLTKGHGGSEWLDPRTAGAGEKYFLTREKVDKWSKEVLEQQVRVPRSADPEEDSGCQERWKNMSEEITEHMWGIFDETGVFLALCRHGFVLLIADMVRSGELAKYGLAITNVILNTFGPDHGAGYDIGCEFCTTISNSSLGSKAKAQNFKTLVGAFHGHAHNRMCQLKYLATYVPGLGLEDLEGCEHFFSKSNALSRSVRYASVFHRRTFIVNNYKQALNILDLEDSLKYAMDEAGISGLEVFKERLTQEKEYLKNLSKEPEVETDQMEYYQNLVNLADRVEQYDTAHTPGSNENGTVKRHCRENRERALNAVQEMERKMGIRERWTRGSLEWNEAAELVSTRRYRLAINKLEELVVKRLFELTKMNMSETGYKSRTIRTALGRYNAAAATLSPPRRTLTWNKLIEFTFLADFDILHDPEGNAEIRPWATPASQELMDTYFKIERAKEEIQRLNIEICCFVTYIQDEKMFLLAKETEVRASDPHLGFFVGKYRMRRGRFDDMHMKRLKKMVKKLGSRFTGTLTPGVKLSPELERCRSAETSGTTEDGWETDDSEGEGVVGEDMEEEELAVAMETVLVLATDKEV
ncbi:hypothetical protein B0H19DRAFT_1211105 [Mycena capillaripes]|nr:hypothetical protein B0H19DRAFT_1211105 [Mycena capillaripes]